MFCAAPQTITRIMLKISDHREHNKYNNNLKVWKVIIMKMWHRHKLANDVGKMMPIALHVAGCHKSAISYKTQFLWSPVKQASWNQTCLYFQQCCVFHSTSKRPLIVELVTSVISDSLRSHGLVAHQVPLSMDSPGNSTRVGWHSSLQGIFPTQGSNLGLLHCRQILYH